MLRAKKCERAKHPKEIELACESCDYKCYSRMTLERHLKIKHGNVTFKHSICDHCKKGFSTKFDSIEWNTMEFGAARSRVVATCDQFDIGPYQCDI